MLVGYRVGITYQHLGGISHACICKKLPERGAEAPPVASGSPVMVAQNHLGSGSGAVCAERLRGSQGASGVPRSVKREHPHLPPVAGPKCASRRAAQMTEKGPDQSQKDKIRARVSANPQEWMKLHEGL